MKQPVQRSKLRTNVGKIYYISKRYLKWYFNDTYFANEKHNAKLPFIIYKHQTPLLRKLKNVDMWLQQNKVHNIHLAIKNINGIVLKPGETFSYWKLIGKPTKGKGYVNGMVLSHGSYKVGIGGGLCQLSNLIYWMTLHTPLTVIERHRHSYDVFPDSNRTQPFGSGATCYFNYIDLQIRNETTQNYQLHLYLTKDYLVGEWRAEKEPVHSYKIYEKDHFITMSTVGKYVRHNVLHRKVYNNNGDVCKDEYITENHAIMMYEPLLEQGKGIDD
ncbi:VanW family protein [Bacillus sp. SM2101]|uniref:VanW family protein n=1 Tax=Bacillus sp. SM2101 TaxID=2805366 RepID=UPI001BDF2863|nr:VanW family protein [Bacillus sp. SM2101]